MKAVAIFLTLSLILCMVPVAFAAAPPALNKSDFTLRLGKSSFDLLTQNPNDLVRITKKKLRPDLDYMGILKATEAMFFCGNIVDRVILTSKGQTVRGLKIGATLSTLTEFYGEPSEIWDYNTKTKTYVYHASPYPDSLTDDDWNKIESKRPLYYYSLVVSVSNKTQKVTSIEFRQEWGD